MTTATQQQTHRRLTLTQASYRLGVSSVTLRRWKAPAKPPARPKKPKA